MFPSRPRSLQQSLDFKARPRPHLRVALPTRRRLPLLPATVLLFWIDEHITDTKLTKSSGAKAPARPQHLCFRKVQHVQRGTYGDPVKHHARIRFEGSPYYFEEILTIIVTDSKAQCIRHQVSSAAGQAALQRHRDARPPLILLREPCLQKIEDQKICMGIALHLTAARIVKMC